MSELTRERIRELMKISPEAISLADKMRRAVERFKQMCFDLAAETGASEANVEERYNPMIKVTTKICKLKNPDTVKLVEHIDKFVRMIEETGEDTIGKAGFSFEVVGEKVKNSTVEESVTFGYLPRRFYSKVAIHEKFVKAPPWIEEKEKINDYDVEKKLSNSPLELLFCKVNCDFYPQSRVVVDSNKVFEDIENIRKAYKIAVQKAKETLEEARKKLALKVIS